ncbi:hypothetical protein TRAPUB_9047 [Trametes pubescens]|uniref:Uncharacterized protein n=1 Tax=Trametes pubescens TaxID=154538 RepID=A0A1M2W3M2_TRAPU|nr:hypothetical protein TRAPUB_9047 [Trametes pubescens]
MLSTTRVPIPLFPSTCHKPDEPAAFSTLAALARLGYKYSIDRIFTAAIKRLKAVFTDDFQAWRAHEGRTTPLVKFTRNDAIEAVNLFRKSNQARLLPSALYMCCSLSVHTLLHGAQRADGTVEKLALNDLERCLVAQQKIEARSTAFNHRMLDFSDPARPACVARDSPTCSTRLPQLLRGLGDAVGALGGDAGASTRQQCLRVFVETHRSPEMRETLGLCRICAEYVLSSDLLFSEELWHDLPSVLDLPVSEWH